MKYPDGKITRDGIISSCQGPGKRHLGEGIGQNVEKLLMDIGLLGVVRKDDFRDSDAGYVPL